MIRASTALIFILGAIGSSTLEFASDALDYFPEHHTVRDHFESLDEDGAALSTIELILGDVPQDMQATLESRLAQVEGVRKVIGPEVVRRDLEKTLGGFAATLATEPALVQSGRKSADGRYTRWSVFTATGGAKEMKLYADRIEEATRQWLGNEGTEFFTCGSLLGTLAMQVALTSTLVTSLLLTLLVTTLLFFFVVRSIHELCIAVTVNLLPVAMVLLINATSFGQIDPATVMVTAVVLGLAVDNTFHLLYAAGAHGRKRSRRDRIRAFQAVGEPAVASSLALACGFGVLAVSSFAPTARFGALVAAGVLTAILSDFLLLPALWLGRQARTRR